MGNAALYIAVDLQHQLDRHRRIRRHNLHRRQLRDASNAFTLPEEQFQSLFRISREMGLELCNRLGPRLLRRRAHGLSVQIQVLTALRIYTVGSVITQRQIGQEFHLAIAQPTVSNCLKAVTLAILEEFSSLVVFPQTATDRSRIKQRFMQERGFPGVIGCLGGIHIAIMKPKEQHQAFINSRGHYTLNVMLICDHDLNILAVDARFPGDSSVSFIWGCSPIMDAMQQLHDSGEKDSWLLGGQGYASQPWLLTPISNPAPDSPETRYNTAHAATKGCVDRCFAVLKTRWNCLHSTRYMNCDERTAGRIVYACAMLHNWMLQRGMPMPAELLKDDDDDANADDDTNIDDVADNDESDDEFGDPFTPREKALARDGIVIRQQLIQNHFT